MATSTIEKIALLLNKAENTTNQHEAEAFFAKAQEIATRESIDLETARSLPGSNKDELTQKMFVTGKKRTFGLHTHVRLLNWIANVNDVRLTVSDDSTVCMAYGHERDIAITEALYTSLLMQMHSESEKFIQKGEYRSEMVWREGYHEGGVWKPAGWRPMHGSTARISFKDAFASRVGQRLQAARRTVLEEPGGSRGELVLVSRRKRVDDFFSNFVNNKKHWNGGAGATHSAAGRRAGVAAANRASLGGTSVGGSRQALS